MLTILQYLARHILDQRTELEQFFLDALEEVKKEIYKQKEMKLNLPSISPTSPKAQKTADISNKKVEIKDLTWQDKEKVLRMVFEKMNNPQK